MLLLKENKGISPQFPVNKTIIQDELTCMDAAEASMGHPRALPAEDARNSVSTVTPSLTELFTKLHTPWNDRNYMHIKS